MATQPNVPTIPVRPRIEPSADAAVLRSIPDAIIQTNAMGRIRALNPAAEALTGWTEQEALDHPLSELVEFGRDPEVSDDTAAAVDSILSCKSNSELCAGYLTIVRKRKKLLAWISGAATVLDGERCAVFTIRDITAMDQLQRDYFRTRHLEGLQRLAGGLAAEYINLITAAQGSLEALLRSGKLAEREVRQLHGLRRAVDGTTAITRQLLAFSRRREADTRIVDLNSTIRSMLPLLEETAGQKSSLVVKLAPVLAKVELDPSHLEDALLALVRHASHSMPDGGVIQISTRPHEVTDQQALRFVDFPAGSYVLLEVSDNGVALSGSQADGLFEPYFSVRTSSDGLELAGAYGSTKQAGGHMWHESTPRDGRRFFLCWPEAQVAEEPVTAEPETGRETVLVLEHDEGTKELVRRSLLTRDYHLLEAGTATEALRVSRQWDGDIHLLLVNVFTSSATGPEVAKKLQAVRPTVKVLYMSSYAARVLQQAGAPKMGTRFIQKPFSPEALARRIRQVLDTD